MVLMAADTESSFNPGVLLAGFVLGALLLYGLGYARAVMHRANRDYKAVKAGLPGMRKTFWATWWAAVKAGFLGLLVLACLIVWLVYRNDPPVDAGTTKPSVSPSPAKSR